MTGHPHDFHHEGRVWHRSRNLRGRLESRLQAVLEYFRLKAVLRAGGLESRLPLDLVARQGAIVTRTVKY